MADTAGDGVADDGAAARGVTAGAAPAVADSGLPLEGHAVQPPPRAPAVSGVQGPVTGDPQTPEAVPVLSPGAAAGTGATGAREPAMPHFAQMTSADLPGPVARRDPRRLAAVPAGTV